LNFHVLFLKKLIFYGDQQQWNFTTHPCYIIASIFAKQARD